MEQLTAAQQAAELNKKNLFATYNHIEAEFVEPDHAIFKLEIRPESKNPYGIVHGGAIYTMADNATGEFTYFCIDPDIMAQKAAQHR